MCYQFYSRDQLGLEVKLTLQEDAPCLSCDFDLYRVSSCHKARVLEASSFRKLSLEGSLIWALSQALE